MTEGERHWFAGWLEGEGTFLYSDYSHPRISIQVFSIDLDTIVRAAKIADAAVYFMKPGPIKGTTYIKRGGHRFNLEGEKAADLMRAVLPLMGERRTVQIQRALGKWETRRNKPSERECACGCGEMFFGRPRRRFINNTHTMRVWRANQSVNLQ